MKTGSLRLALAAAWLALAAACHRGGSSPLAARVNGEAIVQADLELEERLQGPSTLGRSAVLEELIDLRLLLQEAGRLGVQVRSEELEAQLRLAMSGTPAEGFDASLKARGLSMAQWRARLRQQALADEVVRREVRGRVEISRQDIKDYYWEHVPEFRSAEKLLLRQVFTRSRTKAEAAARELELGEDFAGVAARHGEGPEAARGGDLGWVSRGLLPGALADQVFRLKPGRSSSALRSPWGWHLFKVEARRGKAQLSLDQAAPQIHALLTRRREQPLFQAYLAGLRERSKIERLLPEPTPASGGAKPQTSRGKR